MIAPRRLWRYGAVGLALGFMALYAKSGWLDNSGYRIAARGMGLATEAALGRWERLGFFRADLFMAGMVLPMLGLGLAWISGPRSRPWLLVTLATLVWLAFYIQVRALVTVGSFLSGTFALSAFRFGLARPDMIREYVSVSGLLKALVVLSFAVAAVMWAQWRERRPRPERAISRVDQALKLGWGSVLVLCLLAWIPRRIPATPYHHSVLGQALLAYASAPEGVSTERAPLSVLAGRYRELVGAPESRPDPRFWGRARGFDLVFFVLETIPSRCIDAGGPLDDLPALKAARARSLIATRHHVSYPYSSLSNFSLFTSLYPPELARAYMARHAQDRVPGMLWRLRELGYRTSLYEPFPDRFEDDPTMFRIVGFENQVVPGTLSADGAAPSYGDIAHSDSLALAHMIRDVRDWTRSGQRYVAVLAPQMTHAPWHDAVPGRQGADPITRCRSLAQVQDRWIGTVVDSLRRFGTLDRTILLISGDHGVRTSREDPSFEPGLLDAYSFHVPLFVFAPGIFDTTIQIDNVTSNIDIGPSVLDLVGVERSRDAEQGNALWDGALARRKTFVLALQLFGANGFYDGAGRFLQSNRVTGVVCRAPGRLQCKPEDMVPTEDPLADSVRTLLTEFSGLKDAWLEAVTNP